MTPVGGRQARGEKADLRICVGFGHGFRTILHEGRHG